MTIRAYCTQRNGRNPERESAISHPVIFSGNRDNLDCTTISSTSTDPRHYRRCFPQFDRKTDCFRNGIRAAYRRMAGVGENVNLLKSVKWPQNSVSRVSHPARRALGRYIRRLQPSWRERSGNGVPFTKAVCGTQTRQGRSLNKNQRDSQKWDFSSMVRASGCGPEDGGSIPSFPSTWQKSGIGVAAVSPVPLRGIR